MTIQPLGFLETENFQASFVLKYKSLLSADLNNVDTLLLRSATEDTPLLREWKQAQRLLMKVKNQATRFIGNKPVEFGLIEIQRFRANTATPWRIEEDDGYYRLHLCIIPSPGLFIHSGEHRALIPVGMLNYVSHTVLHSEANFSEHPAVHLVMDVKIPDAD